MKLITLSKANWNSILDVAEDNLIGSKKILFTIPNADIINSNNTQASLFPTKFGVYSIWVNGVCNYIGEAKNLRNRLKQHLFGASGSASKNAQVLAHAQIPSSLIQVSFIEVDVSSMRYAVEDGLINRLTGTNYSLPWNTLSVSHKRLEKWVIEFLKSQKKIFKMKASLEIIIEAAYAIDFGMNNRIQAVLQNMVQNGMLKFKVVKGENCYYL